MPNFEYVIQGRYEGKWEDECCAETRKEAAQNLQDYRANCPNTRFRLFARIIAKGDSNTEKEEGK